jgi:hypothetical protein
LLRRFCLNRSPQCPGGHQGQRSRTPAGHLTAVLRDVLALVSAVLAMARLPVASE